MVCELSSMYMNNTRLYCGQTINCKYPSTSCSCLDVNFAEITCFPVNCGVNLNGTLVVFFAPIFLRNEQNEMTTSLRHTIYCTLNFNFNFFDFTNKQTCPPKKKKTRVTIFFFLLTFFGQNTNFGSLIHYGPSKQF